MYPELVIAEKIVGFRMSNPDGINNPEGQNAGIKYEIEYEPYDEYSLFTNCE